MPARAPVNYFLMTKSVDGQDIRADERAVRGQCVDMRLIRRQTCIESTMAPYVYKKCRREKKGTEIYIEKKVNKDLQR